MASSPPSRLLSLPAELRLNILERLIPTQRHRLYILPGGRVHTNQFFQVRHSNCWYFGALASCNQLYSELSAIIYERLTFEFYIEGPERRRAVAKYIGQLDGLGLVKRGVKKAVVKACAWQWPELKPAQVRALRVTAAEILHAINEAGRLESARFEFQDDGQAGRHSTLDQLVGKFSTPQPGTSTGKVVLQSGKKWSVRYHAGEVLEVSPLINSFEM